MMLIFDYFETIVNNISIDFNRGLRIMWEKYYKDKCSFEEICAYGEEEFQYMLKLHGKGLEYAFVKDELPKYAKKFGGQVVNMSVEEETDFLMKCNEVERMPFILETLAEFDKMGIPMYVLSNSGFSGEALAMVLESLGIRKYFKAVWSSADFGKIKPNREFYDMAINSVLQDNPTETKEDIVFVGDTYSTDIKGASNAGIHAIWINHKGEQNVDNLSITIINNTNELLCAVKILEKH